jgi:hypothetical protein
MTQQRRNILDNFDFGDGSFFEETDGEVVAKYYSPLEAEVAAARLRSEGIPCFLANSHSQSVLAVPLMVRLHVLPKHIDLARSILAEAAIDTESGLPEKTEDHTWIFLWVVIGMVVVLLLKAITYF